MSRNGRKITFQWYLKFSKSNILFVQNVCPYFFPPKDMHVLTRSFFDCPFFLCCVLFEMVGTIHVKRSWYHTCTKCHVKCTGFNQSTRSHRFTMGQSTKKPETSLFDCFNCIDRPGFINGWYQSIPRYASRQSFSTKV